MKVFLNKMNKYISKFLLKFLIKNLKFLSKYTNIAIKYLNNNKRFSLIKRNIKFIRSIIIETRLYKFYKLYKRTIKIITIFHLLIILNNIRFSSSECSSNSNSNIKLLYLDKNLIKFFYL